MFSYWRLLILLFLLSALVGGCRDADPPTELEAISVTPARQATEAPATAIPPTMTPEPTAVPTPTATPLPPLAAMVNGRPVFLSNYETEIARYEQAQLNLGLDASSFAGYHTQVLDALIERELVLGAADAEGVSVDAAEVDARLETLRQEAGGETVFANWLETNNYSASEFHAALTDEMVSGAMSERVTADVVTAVEQVRASYIQLEDEATAQEVRRRISAGDDFTFLAQQFSVDKLTGQYGGDLGFFPQGGLLVPEVEAAAFALQPGETSDVIAVTHEDGVAYYIIMVTERDPSRDLTADMRYERLSTAFNEWLDGLWAAASIERFTGSE